MSCGIRRGPLPAHARPVAGGLAFGPVSANAIAEAPEPDPAGRDSQVSDAWLSAPRAAAVAVMGMLGFGVILGSLVGESTASPGAAIVAVSGPRGGPAGSAGTAGGGSGGGGGTRTVTVGSATAPPSWSARQSGQGSSSDTGNSNGGGSGETASALPPVKHVFLIMLSDQGYNQTFGHVAFDPYLAKTLAKQGEVVQNYYAVAQSELANELALISGQGPTRDTLANCPTYTNVEPGLVVNRGQVLGNGCVYPMSTETLASQLTAAHRQWRAYVQNSGSARQACQAAPKLGRREAIQPTAKDPYVAWRNPFLYFHSLTKGSSCRTDDVDLPRLKTDLRSVKTTPTLSYIVPGLCDDGSDTPCRPKAPAGMAAADKFLKTVVPKIERSSAYKSDGLIAVTFDQAPQSGPDADQSSCCGSPKYPNVPSPTPAGTTGSSGSTGTTTTDTTPAASTTTSTTSTTTPTSAALTTTGASSTTTSSSTTGTGTTTTTTSTSTAPPSLGAGETNSTGGGGQVGLLLISKYVAPDSMEVTDYYNHFSLLASLEELLGLSRIGYAHDSGLPVFGNAVYTKYTG